MKIGEITRFQEERFFEGAVQLSWVHKRCEQAARAAKAFVFHGPRYHGIDDNSRDGLNDDYRLKDTASFLRDLVQSLVNGIDNQEVNPYWLVVAGYGSGKSHLALTCASLLKAPTSEVSRSILEQLQKADAAIAHEVTALLEKLNKPALILPLDGMSGFHLGSALSRSVFEQLRIHDVDTQAIRALSPRFQVAEQFVIRNYEIRSASFQTRLPHLIEAQICDRLREQDESIYIEVDAIYNEANGQPIPIEGQESAQDLIDTLCSVYCSDTGPFSSVVILFDEFGRYLEYAAERPHLAGDAALQQIFQGVQDNGSKVRFVGLIQYELKAYLKRFGGVDLRQLQRYVTRFDSADKFYLSTNLETIFAHMIGKNESRLEQEWTKNRGAQLSQQTWERIANALPSFSRYPTWAEQEQFIQVIAKGCWPMHPLAVWLLTRQRDVVQSRSALTFIKDVLVRVSDQQAGDDGNLRRVSPAELVLEHMLPELIGAEREVGGSTAETLQGLLEKFQGYLTHEQRVTLAGVTALEKIRVGKQPQTIADELLSEATEIAPRNLTKTLSSLSELGVLEWNRDLGKYELISDGASRGQFQQWLRKPVSELSSDAIRDLWVRRAATDTSLNDIHTDFGARAGISTPDWYFEKSFAHARNIDAIIERASDEWQSAHLPKDAKGKIIYLYLHPDDDAESVRNSVSRSFDLLLKKTNQTQAPVWVVALIDRKSEIASLLGRLHVLNDMVSPSDAEKFGRFIPEEIERSHTSLKDLIDSAAKERVYWVAGFEEPPTGRLKTVGQAIFAGMYPAAIPFPFDGFATTAGGGAGDAAQLARGLVSRLVNVSWVQAQPRRLQNRVDAVLVKAWKALLPSGKLGEPQHPCVQNLFEEIVQSHKDDPKRTLLDTYQNLVRPPYGLNASSAALLLGLVLSKESPPCRIEQDGQLVTAADWICQVYPNQRSHYLELKALAQSQLRFLSEDSATRWRRFLTQWESEQNYVQKVALARQAKKLLSADPIPETLEAEYKYLRDATLEAERILLDTDEKLKRWEKSLERSEREPSAIHSLRVGAQAATLREEMTDTGLWSESYVTHCDTLIALAKRQLEPLLQNWILHQTCRNISQLSEFRQRSERAARDLNTLGYKNAGKALLEQTHSSIVRVEQLQNYTLTLSQSDDYPRQPDPTSETTIVAIRDEISKGDQLIQTLREASKVLTPGEIKARIASIEQRQKRLGQITEERRNSIARLYSTPETEESIREGMIESRALLDPFRDSPEGEELEELILQFERIHDDLQQWKTGDTDPEEARAILFDHASRQRIGLGQLLEEKNIDPAWDLEEVYQALIQERVDLLKQRSNEWIVALSVRLQRPEGLGLDQCLTLASEVAAAPTFLSQKDREELAGLTSDLKERIALLQAEQRYQIYVRWAEKYLYQDYSNLNENQAANLLEQLKHPPCELRTEEQAQTDQRIALVASHIDSINLNDLVSRISRLPLNHQRQLALMIEELLLEQSRTE